MSAEERAELKKRQIEAEFIRYKLARRQKQMREGGENEINDQGEYRCFYFICIIWIIGVTKVRPEDEVEFKVAAKAREKFNKIDSKVQPREAKVTAVIIKKLFCLHR
jgi:hypothetical protein